MLIASLSLTVSAPTSNHRLFTVKHAIVTIASVSMFITSVNLIVSVGVKVGVCCAVMFKMIRVYFPHQHVV